MTISEKLTKVNDIKGEIRDAIISKGIDIDTNTLFEEYPSKIEEIQAGGGSSTLDISEQPEIKFGNSFFTEVPDCIVGWDKLENGNYIFYDCGSLISFNIDLPVLTNGINMFYSCKSLQSWNVDLPSLKRGDYMFRYCSKLTSFNVDLPKLDNGYYMFNNCSGLTSFESDLPVLTNGDEMFASCSGLISFESNLPKLESGYYMFNGCSKLYTFKSNLSSLKSSTSMFRNCSTLTDVELSGTLNYTIDWSTCPLTVDSILSILNVLVDLTGQSSKTMTFGATNLAKLSDEQKGIAINKNWVLS